MPGITASIEGLVESTTNGDPMSPLQWTCKSTGNLAEELGKIGMDISHTTVAQTMHEMGYSLQGNRKGEEGKPAP